MLKYFPRTTEHGTEKVEAFEGPGGVMCRKDTYDRNVALEVLRAYSTLPLAGRVVLDVGANIGAFSRKALLAGAKLVVAVEPETSNFACLQENTLEFGDRIVRINACVDLLFGSTKIWLSSGTNPGNTSQTQRRGRFSQEVKTVSYSYLMERYQPESVKLDCEGAEYSIGWPHHMYPCVRDVSAEIHIQGFNRGLFEGYCQSWRDWECLVSPNVDPNSKIWHTYGAWRRR